MNTAHNVNQVSNGILNALHQMPFILFTMNEKGIITGIYGGDLEKLNQKADALIGTCAFHNKMLPVNRSIFRQALEGQKVNNTFPVGEFIYETHFIPLIDDSQKIVGVSVYGFDVTSTIKMETELEEERFRFAHNQNLLSLARMAGGVAHEINNPLAIVKGYVELIQRMVESGSLDTARIGKMANTLINTCDRIRNIVQGLVDFSTDQTDGPFALVPLAEILTMSYDLVRSRLDAAHVTVRWPTVDPKLIIECRRSDFAKVVVNLLINSLESIQNSKERWIEVQVSDTEEYVNLTVVDSGPPIPSHIKEKVFEPFFTTKGTSHSGLGLSISRGLVDNHGGRIEVMSTTKNTGFLLVFPKIVPENLKQVKSSEDKANIDQILGLT